jgi:hypothetical protein
VTDNKQFLIDNPVLKTVRDAAARYEELSRNPFKVTIPIGEQRRTMHHLESVLANYVPMLLAIIYERDQYEMEQAAKRVAAQKEEVVKRFEEGRNIYGPPQQGGWRDIP